MLRTVIESISAWVGEQRTVIKVHYESITRTVDIAVARVFLYMYFSFPGFVYHLKVWYLSVNLVYVLLFLIARNILFVVTVISHDYSRPLSKLFCLKGSLNPKERRGDFLVVFCESCTFRMVQFISHNIFLLCYNLVF